MRPTYETRETRYEIDRCEPQNNAIQSGSIDFYALSKGNYPGVQIPQSLLRGLSSIGFWNADNPQDWDEEPHRNEGIEITFLETGSIALATNHKKYDLHAGQFAITQPWQLHKLGNIEPGRLHWLILDVGVRHPDDNWHWPSWMVLTKDDLRELTRKLRENDDPVWTATPVMAQAFREIARTIEAWDQPHAVSRLATNLNQLFLGILGALSEGPAKTLRPATDRQQVVVAFLNQIKNDPVTCGESWTINQMAGHCELGVTAFSKYCRELVNAGPMEFLNRCRLDHALTLLRQDSGLSITDIAMTCGFNSSQYFATRFRRRFHMAPSEFAAQAGTLNFGIGQLKEAHPFSC